MQSDAKAFIFFTASGFPNAHSNGNIRKPSAKQRFFYMNITHFDRVKLTPDQYEKHTREISIQDFLESVKTPNSALEKKIHAIRNEQNENKRNELKATLPAVSISATFPAKRHAKSAGVVTGLLQIDIDKCADAQAVKKQMCEDPHTFACFISPSGNGVKAIVRTDAKATDADGQVWKNNEHKTIYSNAVRYYKQHFAFDIDKSCSDISRLMYYSHDPEIYINEDATPLQHVQAPKIELPKTSKSDRKKVPRKVLDIVDQIESSGESVSYNDRLYYGMALTNEYGEQGRNLFHRISRNHENYDHEKFDAKLDDFIKSSRGEISIGSFYHLAKEKGFVPDKNADLIRAVQELGIRHNVVTGEYEIPVQESLYPDDRRTIFETLRDKTENSIYVNLKSAGHNVNIHELRTLIHSDLSPSYNPFTDYLDTIRHLQDPETPALKQVLASLPVKDVRIIPFIQKWLISIISAMHGKPSDLLLVFCGGQGTGKTVFFETLLPPALRKYYAESAHEGSKDDLLLMCRSLLLLDDEYHGRSKRESEKIKAILSQKEFTIRASYARNHETRKRYAVFCGTSNISEIKFDITGNRRIIPVELTGAIDRKLYTAKEYSEHDTPNRDQLFADLLYLYNQDPNTWRVSGSDAKELNEITAENDAHSLELDLIDQCFKPSGSDGAQWLSISQIIQHIENETGMRVDPPSRNKFSLALRKLGYVKEKKREPNSRRTDAPVWGYIIARHYSLNSHS